MVKRSKASGRSQQFQVKNVKKHKDFIKGNKKSGASTNPDRKLDAKQKNGGFMRDKAKINLLNLYRNKPDMEKMREKPTEAAKIQPDRKWFGNIRTIGQKSLEEFRVEMQKQNQQQNSANQFLIKSNKLPLSLLTEQNTTNQVKILEVESYTDTFGPKQKRKKPKLQYLNYQEMNEGIESKVEKYDVNNDNTICKEYIEKEGPKDKRLEAGQSKRIWEELYKVLDSSDVICQVVDARDPIGTRCKHIEEHLKRNLAHKHLVLILNKVDLIPTWLTKRWVAYLSKEFPTIAYHASVQNSFGKGSLINLLRQFDNFHKDKKNISVGFIGYPNVGKSSIINSLKQKKVCRAAPIPGETKVWQYVHLTKRIYLIDCPGVVYNYEGKDDVQVVLKGCVRAEKLLDPEIYISYILQQVQPNALQRIYKLKSWLDEYDFLAQVAKQKGKLLKGGEPDLKSTAKIILFDWQRGEIPYFNYPPDYVIKDQSNNQNNQTQEMEIEQEQELQEDLTINIEQYLQNK